MSSTPDAPVNVQVYVVPNNNGNIGVATGGNRIARSKIWYANDTFFIEPEYPINLDKTMILFRFTMKVYIMQEHHMQQ